MVKICKEESFHQRQGYEIIAAMAKGTTEQKEMAQDAFKPFLVAIFNDVRTS